MSGSPAEHILLKMKYLFGHRFTTQWQGIEFNELINMWDKDLKDYSREELIRGYNALKSCRFPPTFPEFLQLCRPPVDPTKAYYEAIDGLRARSNGERGEWSHPAIFWTAAKMAYDLTNKSFSSIKDRWCSELDNELSKNDWREIPDAPKRIERREYSNTDQTKALSALAEINSIINKKGSYDWIARNLERIANGEITNPAVIKITKDAYKSVYGKSAE